MSPMHGKLQLSVAMAETWVQRCSIFRFFKRSQKFRLVCKISFLKNLILKMLLSLFLKYYEEDQTNISVDQMQPKSAGL